MKKTVSFFLAVLLITSLSPLSALAKGTTTPDKDINRPTLSQKKTTTNTVTKTTAGSPTFSISHTEMNPGEAALITVKNVPKNVTVTGSTNVDLSPEFFQRTNGDWVAFLPISYFNTVKEIVVTVKAGSTSKRFIIIMKDKQFPMQNLVVDASTTSQTIQSQAATEEFNKVVSSIVNVTSNQQHWDKTFVWPAADKGWISTAFGSGRIINGNQSNYRHDAIDIALPQGTHVYSTNGGKVLYSGFLQLTGNTVVIEHGYGLKSWYYHMESLDVKTNDSVVRGQKIGQVGSTGFSNGPHLHFGMSVNGIYINPYSQLGKFVLS